MINIHISTAIKEAMVMYIEYMIYTCMTYLFFQVTGCLLSLYLKHCIMEIENAILKYQQPAMTF